MDEAAQLYLTKILPDDEIAVAGEHLVDFLFDDLESVEVLHEALQPLSPNISISVTDDILGED